MAQKRKFKTCKYARPAAGTSWFARMHINCDYAYGAYYTPAKSYCDDCPHYIEKDAVQNG